ncbi:MAG: MMPL family transporter [Treponema sp.]|nr:MMPL family transporter [Treponema sp.]
MKKLILQFHNLMLQKKQGFFLKLWLTVHLGIPALLVLSLFFAPPLRLSVQLLDLLPKTGLSNIAEADNILTEKGDREIVILCASPVFEKAKSSAVSFYNEFKNIAEVESASLFFDSQVIAEFAEYFYQYRFVIAGERTVALLESGNANEIANDALASAYGAFNYIPLDNIDKDPFFLTERRMKEFLSSSLLASGNMDIKEDVLSVQKDGIWYVILRMTLAPHAVSVVDIKNNIIGKVNTVAASIKETEPELELYFSGIPFHSYESASSAQKEITLLSTIALSFIFLLFIIIFRSPIPVIFSILDVLTSLAMSTIAVFLVFREVHVFAFIFGTTLIGICIDYSIHFFIQWKGNTALKNGYEIRSGISKSMIMCFVSSVIGFSAVLFAPFPIFKQFSVFGMAGLLSSFLTAYCIYPLLKLPDERKRRIKLPHGKKISIHPVWGIIIISALALTFIIILYFNPQGIKVKNDLNSLYTMPPFLEESEKRSAMIMDFGFSPRYFIVSGGSAEETLRNEERLILRLEEEIAQGNLGSFLGTSMFVPSVEYQKETYKAMSALLPLAGSQYENLGFPPEYEKTLYEEFAAGAIFCLPEDAPSWTGVSNLWIGEINGYYYSCVLLFHTNDSGIFKSIADEHDSVYLINKEEDINRDLDILTKTIVLSFFAAYFIVVAIIFIVFPLKDSIKISIVPVLFILAVLAVLAVKKIPLGFLPISALILVFGLGLDYIFFMSDRKDGKDKKITRFAVFLSFLTTSLSFGILSLSSFTPVNIFGITVAVGMVAAFVFTMLLQGKIEE